MFKLDSLAYSSKNCSVFKMPRQLVVPLTIFIIILFTVSGLTAFQTQHQPSVLLQAAASSNSQPEELYKKTIENFANAYGVAEGKLFTTDYAGNLLCFDAQTGKRLWNNTVGSCSQMNIIEIHDRILYVGSPGGIVKTVDINTGKLLPLQFQAIVDTSWGSKSPPTAFTIVDGRIFVDQSSGWRAYNVSTGELLWESFTGVRTNPPDIPYNVNVWAFDNNLVLATGGYRSGNTFYNGVYRINPDTGTILWSISGFSNNQPLVYNDRIIFWNCNETGIDTGQTVISVDASTGDILWNIDLQTMIYQPIIYQDQLLFATTDGHFCALKLPEGSLFWKTRLTSNPIFSEALTVQIDSQAQKLFWGYITAIAYNGKTNNYQYIGNLYSLDLTEGTVIWKNSFNAGISFYPSTPHWQTEIAVLNNAVFLSTGVDLWAFNKLTGMKFGLVEQFEHYLLPIVSEQDKLFVVADLNIIVYHDYLDSTIMEPNSSPKMYQQIIVLVVIVVIVVLLFLVYRKYTNKHNIA
jgi:outer membrane protein assembly factor BamB